MRIYYLNLYHYFDVVITFDDSGERKPSSKPFQLWLKTLNLEPKETIMVGDWPERDVVGAKKIGMRTAFARYGDTFGTINSGADWDLNDINQLVLIVNEIMELPNFFIGTDIVEVDRINKLLLRSGELFKNKVFTSLNRTIVIVNQHRVYIMLEDLLQKNRL